MRRYFLILPLFFLVAIASGKVNEHESSTSLSDIWRWNELSLFGNYHISSGIEGKGGVLWFVTSMGLIEYDGKKIVEHPIEGVSLENIADLHVSSDGRIFIITNTGFILWNEGRVEDHEGIPYGMDSRNVVVEFSEGSFLLVNPEGGLFRFDKSGLSSIDLNLTRPSSLLLDAQNNLWVVDAGTHIVSVYDLPEDESGTLNPKLLHAFPGFVQNEFEPRLFEDSRGRVWVIDPDEEDRCFLYEEYIRKPAIEGLREAALWSEVLNIVEPPGGEILFSVRRKLGSFDGSALTVYDFADYPIPSSPVYLRLLSSNKLLLGGRNLNPLVIDISTKHWKTFSGLNFQCEDLEGRYWFLSNDRQATVHYGDDWLEYGADSGLIDTPNRIIAGSDGSIWASGAHQGVAAVAYFLNDQWNRFLFPEACKTFSHLAAIESSDGSFFFGCGTPTVSLGSMQGGGVVFEKKGDRYVGTHLPPPVFLERPATLAERVGDGFYMGEGYVAKGFASDQFTARDVGVFKNQWIDHIIVDSNNDLWVACLGIGIYQFDGSTWRLHGPETGLTSRHVICLLEDQARGGIIAMVEEGFFYYDGSRWAAWGFESNVPFKRENHTMAQSSDGAIWINFSSRPWFLEGESMESSPSEFKAIRYLPDAEPPETFAFLPSSRYSEGSQIYVQFDGVDSWYDTPRGELMYSWKMDDKAWSNFSYEIKVELAGLHSGPHLLQVRARDKAANWDPTPAIVEFAIIPPLWKRPWFILVMLSLVLLIIYLSYSLFRSRVMAAVALDNFKLDFFTNISHELRNPLAVILAPAERMLSEEKDAAKRKNLQIILRNARKMEGMVDQLLQFRRIEKGKLVADPSGGEIMGFIRDELNSLEPLWEGKKQHFTLSTQPDSHLCTFDSMVIRTIVDNLVSNAIKYSDEGASIRMTVLITEVDDSQHLEIQVEDEGVAIPTHEQENILMPFYRIRDKGKTVGSGIGLALVHQLVRVCGGTISIESPLTKSGKGSRFTVNLPVDPFEEIEYPEPPETADKGKSESRPRALIVEDNADFRHVLAQELSATCEIIEAPDGISGLKQAEDHDHDIIISDVMMPKMGGFALCEKLKSNPKTSHVPIILLTAKRADEHRIKGLRLGADAYIPKPFNVSYLLAQIENLINSRKALRKRFSETLVIQPSEVTVTPVDERILKKAIKVVEDNIREEEFNVQQFSQLMGMSKSSLVRKLTAITGLTPLRFIQNMRLKRAASLLSTGDISVSEAASMVGMYNMSYFSKVFRKEFGVVPSEFRSAQHPAKENSQEN